MRSVSIRQAAGDATHPGSPPAPAPKRRAGRRRSAPARVFLVYAVLTMALLISVAWAPTVGVAGISPTDVWSTILAHLHLDTSPLDTIEDGIVWHLRLPRVLVAVLVGAGLALCGAVLQALTRNALADPYLLGLSSGASMGAVAVLVLQVAVPLPVAAFGGGLLALVTTLTLAGSRGRTNPSRTILAGVAVSAAFGAVTSLVIFWSAKGDSYREILNWLLGSLSGTDWPGVALAAATFALVGMPLLLTGRTLDAFAFGEVSAASLGVHVERTRWLLLGATALLTSALVAVSGAIGFVGLVLPHAARLLVGSRHSALLPLTALLGGLLLLWSDTAARLLFDPLELPVGIITAVLGAPVFALLLARSGEGR